MTQTPDAAPVLTAVRNYDRYCKCASCRATAIGTLYVDGQPSATFCQRHQALWVRRAKEGKCK